MATRITHTFHFADGYILRNFRLPFIRKIHCYWYLFQEDVKVILFNGWRQAIFMACFCVAFLFVCPYRSFPSKTKSQTVKLNDVWLYKFCNFFHFIEKAHYFRLKK